MIDAMNAVNALCESLSMPYGYALYDQSVEESSVYWTGECQVTGIAEDGSESGYITLSGWSLVDGPMPLLEANARLKTALAGSRRVRTRSGAVVLTYSTSMDVPSDVAGVHRQETTIKYTEWS